ncbi:hypothetical protein ThrDRAFT_01494 [Frankia casuarinae]|uniref:hypothetical protein n=1 Tax=Frankia TaxID=1854 RepID=UPI0002E865E6|nr:MULTISPECIES: hypothetical protein [Frankia]ETA03055.1 hypothetical protein CcI6DRAFT_01579 [Frankia sp. CcI6]EYT92916.1 hypothetical protein ThrDRAFT_01494 [Frankia casuarinae]KDA44041.1 hypothetical protein BMG523Draft_01135 [Frankia sp. BMG5.23]KEZ37625.1 hypothetical protein CEDDRAFT_00898 [Frankia sp. CeD]KFB05806.1 hypothetical protein ALLO2DRAFT_01444 [Frankia sp. Allo2]
MWETEPELLVVFHRPDRGFSTGTGVDPLAELAVLGTVTSALRPRLALVALPPSRAPEVAALPGVCGVFIDQVPPALRETLTAAESLFVDGWLARRGAKRRDPAGGEPWDTPGYLPPDRPPGAAPAG